MLMQQLKVPQVANPINTLRSKIKHFTDSKFALSTTLELIITKVKDRYDRQLVRGKIVVDRKMENSFH